jgi:hypothetical protein
MMMMMPMTPQDLKKIVTLQLKIPHLASHNILQSSHLPIK